MKGKTDMTKVRLTTVFKESAPFEKESVNIIHQREPEKENVFWEKLKAFRAEMKKRKAERLEKRLEKDRIEMQDAREWREREEEREKRAGKQSDWEKQPEKKKKDDIDSMDMYLLSGGDYKNFMLRRTLKNL